MRFSMKEIMNGSEPPKEQQINRRGFLKLGGFGVASLAFLLNEKNIWLKDISPSEKLGRVAVGMVELKLKPDMESPSLGVLYEDALVSWLRETSGIKPAFVFNNQRWVETPDGYIYGPYLQPVYQLLNQPVAALPVSSHGQGMWVEVTVPFAEAVLDKTEPSSNSWVEAKVEQGQPLRVYYSQVFWVDQLKTLDNGQVFYRINPNYYGGVDMLWASAEAFRPITPQDLAPISPEIENKQILVDLAHQTLSCFENNREVFFTRVSTGAKYDMYGNLVDKWATPVGDHRVTRKYISLQMSGGTTGAGYDLPGIAWTSIFAIGGVAIHSTFWHNNYGDPVSHGCVNCRPEDAYWIFRWASPEVVYDPGMVDVTVSGEKSTGVRVIDD